MATSHRNRLKKLETLHRPKCNGNHFRVYTLTNDEPEPSTEERCPDCQHSLFVVKVFCLSEVTE